MDFWRWLRDAYQPRRTPRGHSIYAALPNASRHMRDLATFLPGRATKIPQIFHAEPADIGGTWRLGDASGKSFIIRATYNKLVDVLGQPDSRPGGATTSSWVFLYDGGRFTIYDYKATSEYDENLPALGEFRKRPYNWHVGTDGSGAAARGAALVKRVL